MNHRYMQKIFAETNLFHLENCGSVPFILIEEIVTPEFSPLFGSTLTFT